MLLSNNFIHHVFFKKIPVIASPKTDKLRLHAARSDRIRHGAAGFGSQGNSDSRKLLREKTIDSSLIPQKNILWRVFLRKLESKEAFAWKDHRFESYPAKERIMTSIPKVRNIRCAVITQNRLGANADAADDFRRWVLRIRRRMWNQNRSFVHVII